MMFDTCKGRWQVLILPAAVAKATTEVVYKVVDANYTLQSIVYGQIMDWYITGTIL